jgi:hypothetical protein
MAAASASVIRNTLEWLSWPMAAKIPGAAYSAFLAAIPVWAFFATPMRVTLARLNSLRLTTSTFR